ncbi:MarR family winged helix-turn-helix transcriptional regulator [Amycolatopsis thermophila]|uniref:DNA-binding MarR family transcriptional regulator n=1 Tax=Amycolatopsis thermophila TaxID=206084 RepID=A0ABU0EVY1_9PSEU|nr:MarR family transcriptional regulator [Amycolatopsis thermophila]MDQ0378967.1 DNA-binding MarR family transcriptional regulator [Amycolatopsis thermophila]
MASSDERHVVFRRYLDAVGLHGLAGAEAAGLHATEWYAISLLDLEGSLTSGELSTRTGLTTGATTRLIDRLERAGYVRRTAHPADRRKVIVEPVPDALAGIEAIVGPARHHIAEVIARYTPEQQEVLFDYFARAAPAYRAASEEIRRTKG